MTPGCRARLLYIVPLLSFAPQHANALPLEVSTAIRELIHRFECHSAYLDIGSNVGVQVRKLYEPHLYAGYDPSMVGLAKRFGLYEEPTAEELGAGLVKGAAWWNVTSQVLPIFERFFGPAPRCGVCAIGVEPNPRHEARHQQLQAALQAAGVGGLWLSRTAVDVADGSMTIDMAQERDQDVNDVGMRVDASQRVHRARQGVTVRTIDLADLVLFVRNELRAPPPGTAASRVVMKIDTEGAEYRLLPHLISRGAACAVDLVFLEWHPSSPPTPTQVRVRTQTQRALARCSQTIVSDIDDETFLQDGKPLPASDSRMCAMPRPGAPHRRDDESAAARQLDDKPAASAMAANADVTTRGPRTREPPPGAAVAAGDVTVRVFAAYWPQWHATPLNDYWFGSGYTDWDLVCNQLRDSGGANRNGEQLLRPRSAGTDGFGWYNLSSKAVRRRQALLAKQYGVHGFAIYHFWFSRPEAWGRGSSWQPGEAHGADMDETIMQLLDESDGEPNLPFYLVWANEAFTWRWKTWQTGRVSQLEPGEQQVPQSYPRAGWRPHFDYLLRFFRHPNYHKVDGKPVFGVFGPVIGPVNDTDGDMFDLFRQWAVDAGFPGLHLMQFFHGKKMHKNPNTGEFDFLSVFSSGGIAKWADACQDYGWSSNYGTRRTVGTPRPDWARSGNWHHGLLTDFDNTARMGAEAGVIGSSPQRGGPASFETGLQLLMNATLASATTYGHREKMLLVGSWNEWSEGATLEPNEQFGIGYLEALRRVLRQRGQYRYDGREDAWRKVQHAIPQLTPCAK